MLAHAIRCAAELQENPVCLKPSLSVLLGLAFRRTVQDFGTQLLLEELCFVTVKVRNYEISGLWGSETQCCLPKCWHTDRYFIQIQSTEPGGDEMGTTSPEHSWEMEMHYVLEALLKTETK